MKRRMWSWMLLRLAGLAHWIGEALCDLADDDRRVG
mgnify:CR=1 FL=1